MTTNTDTLVTNLQRQLAALGDGRDARSDHERATYRRDYDAIQGCITGLMNGPNDLARCEASLVDIEARRAIVVEKEAELTKAMADAPDPTTIRDGRARDKEVDRQRDLQRNLQRLREGTLLRGPGITYERLADLDARLAELTKRRDDAQRTLDAHVEQAKALLQPVPVTR